MTKEVEYSLIVCKIHVNTRLAQSSQSKEHKGDTKEKITDEFTLLRVNQCDTNKECWPDEIGNIKRETS